MKKDLVALLILDGWGIGKDYVGNAIKNANTKNYDDNGHIIVVVCA